MSLGRTVPAPQRTGIRQRWELVDPKVGHLTHALISESRHLQIESASDTSVSNGPLESSLTSELRQYHNRSDGADTNQSDQRAFSCWRGPYNWPPTRATAPLATVLQGTDASHPTFLYLSPIRTPDPVAKTTATHA